ncbi:MAG: hemerythrin domain-containing protein, partial [Verrucomicrobiae bacterium]|nr:hemerythrin domain-containing protein [Verrucomicrobiae bacterium]
MKPTEILMAEHRVIEQVLNVLEAMAERAANGDLNRQEARDAVAFFRGFADRCHHGKEEAQLFPAMEAKGIPREGGPIGVMLCEHEQGRAAVRGMAEAVLELFANPAKRMELGRAARRKAEARYGWDVIARRQA